MTDYPTRVLLTDLPRSIEEMLAYVSEQMSHMNPKTDAEIDEMYEDFGEEDEEDAEDERHLLREAQLDAAAHQAHQEGGDEVDAHVALVDDGVDEPVPRMEEGGEHAGATPGRMGRRLLLGRRRKLGR